jgi:putative phosphoribosyl transferase
MAGTPGLLVVALPRGGVPVAFEVARHLKAPLDVFMVRKLGVPGHEELAMGAIASGGVQVLNVELIAELGIPQTAVDRVAEREGKELERRERAYRDGRPPRELRGRPVLLVDDGLATGFTMRAAVMALRHRSAERVFVGVPVGAPETCDDLSRIADDVVCATTPEPFHAVGLWYTDFSQTADDEVRALLDATDSAARKADADLFATERRL